MSDHIWMTRPFGDVDASRSLTSDQLERDKTEAIECGRRNQRGEPLGPECFPTMIWPKPGAGKRDYSPSADIFGGAGNWFVSGRFAGLLRQFDMGQARLHPVKYFEADKETPVKGDWFGLSFGNVKEALVPDQSKGLDETFNPKVWVLDPIINDLDVCFDQVAGMGPDIWIEPALMHVLCLSGPLGDAMCEKGITKGFKGRGMSKGRVVQNR